MDEHVLRVRPEEGEEVPYDVPGGKEVKGPSDEPECE